MQGLFERRFALELPFLSLIGLALGLSMDCAAVAAAKGLAVPRLSPRNVASMMGFFGGFQSLMLLLGFGLGAALGPLVERWDHWIAFALLAGIGIKMIFEAFEDEEERRERGEDPFRWGVLLGLAVATSVDSFAAGIVLPMMEAPLAFSVALVGATAALLTALGLWAGRSMGKLFGRRLEVLGGIILLGLGVKTLAEHL